MHPQHSSQVRPGFASELASRFRRNFGVADVVHVPAAQAFVRVFDGHQLLVGSDATAAPPTPPPSPPPGPSAAAPAAAAAPTAAAARPPAGTSPDFSGN